MAGALDRAGCLGRRWRGPMCRRCGGSAARLLWAPALPLVAAFYMAATIGSAVNHHRGRGVAWKGRAYQESGRVSATETVNVEAWSGKDRGGREFPGRLAADPPGRCARMCMRSTPSPATPTTSPTRPMLAPAGQGGAAGCDGGRAAGPAGRTARPVRCALRESLAADRRHAAPRDRPADRVPARRDQAALCRLGGAVRLLPLSRRCRWGGMCSTCTARSATTLSRRRTRLCAALQVLNHLQDCAKDLAALDRCYLPQDLLARTARRSRICAGRPRRRGCGGCSRPLLDREARAPNRARDSAATRTRTAGCGWRPR